MQDNIKKKSHQKLLEILSRLYFVLILIFTIINIILIGFFIGVWIGGAAQNLFIGSDFHSIFNTFVMMRSDLIGETLKPDVLSILQNGILGGIIKDNVYLLQYPPVLGFIFHPLSFLPFNIAYYIWTLIQLGLIIWLIILLNRQFSRWTKKERILLSLTILAFWPLSITILQGQFSLILLICIVHIYLALNNSKKVNAGVWLALMIIKPQAVLILGSITLNKRYIRAAISAGFTFLVMVFISTIMYGYLSWYKYSLMLISSGDQYRNFGFVPGIEFTLRGLLTGIIGNSQSQLINSMSIIFIFVGIIFTWLLWLPDIPPGTPSFELRFSFITVLSVFLSLHLYPHDSLILVFPAVLFYDYLSQMNYPTRLYSILIFSSPFIFFISAYNNFYIFGVVRPQVLLILLILVWMIRYLILDYRNGNSSKSIRTVSVDSV